LPQPSPDHRVVAVEPSAIASRVPSPRHVVVDEPFHSCRGRSLQVLANPATIESICPGVMTMRFEEARRRRAS